MIACEPCTRPPAPAAPHVVVTMAEVRRLVAGSGRVSVDLAKLGDHDDLFEAGMSSFAAVHLMLALEHRFAVHFPEPMIERRTFATLTAIHAAIGELRGA